MTQEYLGTWRSMNPEVISEANSKHDKGERSLWRFIQYSLTNKQHNSTSTQRKRSNSNTRYCHCLRARDLPRCCLHMVYRPANGQWCMISN